MKTSYRSRTELRTAISQLQMVARRKRVLSQNKGAEKTVFVQEARQLDEALRLLRWISD
jgi:hypothetical protein